MAADNRSLSELPALNLEDVLYKLPLPALLACCAVSNSLLNLIKNDPDFARICFAYSECQLLIHSPLCTTVHLIDLDADTHPALTERVEIKPSFNLPESGFKVTHSCNGLLLLENNMDHVHRSVVCNPVTGEYIMLPDSSGLMVHVTSAFFYCPVTSQFKIFRTFHRVFRMTQNPVSYLNWDSGPDPCMESDLSPDGNSDFDYDSDSESYHTFDSESNFSESDRMGEFLISGSDVWEYVDDVPFSPRAVYSPCYLNNATHWLCADESVKNLIVLFNFETCQFGEIPAPTHIDKLHAKLPDCVNLVFLDGFLSIFENHKKPDRFDVWKMKEYGVKESWIREFVIDCSAWGMYGSPYAFRPAICRQNGEVVMVCRSGHMVFYDLKKKRGRFVFHPPLEDPSKAVVHIPNLMSLRDVTRGNNMVVQNVPERFAPPGSNMRNYVQLCSTFAER